MQDTRNKTNTMAAVAVAVLGLVIFTAGAQEPQNSQPPASKSTVKDSLIVLVKKQQDSPLRIKNIVVDDSQDGLTPNSLTPTVRLTVLNKSDKPIMAYCVKHEVTLKGGGGWSVAVTVNNAGQEHSLPAGQATQVEITGAQYPELPENTVLSIDFVEFADGTRWGADTLETGEVIDGIRAGAQAERETLLNILKAYGPEQVMRSLDSTTPEPDKSIPRSEKWLDGFRYGVGWIRGRLVSKGQNFSEVEKELRYGTDSPNNRK
jgi:hypothetical protein